MKYLLLLLLLTLNCYSDVLRLNLDSKLNDTQRFTASRVQALYNSAITDRGLPGTQNILSVSILVSPIDGNSGILAQTSATSWIPNASGKYVLHGGATITLDSVDVNKWSQSTLSEILTHELGHCFGFQPVIWGVNGNMYAGQYVGPKALLAYKQEYDSFAQYVPTDDSHFSELFMPLDLMSPVLNGNYVSKSFWAVFEDNGNTLGAGARLGYLSSILPRRPVEIITIITNP